MRCIKIVRGCRSAGLVLMFSALGCGGKAEDDARPAQPSFSAPRATPSSPPVESVPQRPQPVPTMQPSPPPPSPPPPGPQRRPIPPPDDELARAAAENVLAANCGLCHGPALTPQQAQAGINYISDIDQLLVARLIVPLNSSTSRIVVVMRDGSMPP